MIVHSRSEIRQDFECPPVSGTEPLQPLVLPLQIRFLVVTGYSSIGNGRSCRRAGVKSVGSEFGQVVSSLAASGPLVRQKPSLTFPSAEGVDFDTPRNFGAWAMVANLLTFTIRVSTMSM